MTATPPLAFSATHGPAAEATPGRSPLPLGPQPDYDDVLDVALAYTFPASDPISCVQGCDAASPTRSPDSSPADEPLKPGDEAPAGTPGTGEDICRDCNGSGQLRGRSCPTCEGTGKVTVGIGGA